MALKLLLPLLLLGVVLATDYAANLQVDASNPFASVDSFNFGEGNTYTIMMHARTKSWSGAKTVFHAYGSNADPGGDDKQVMIRMINGNKFGLCFGRNQYYTEVNANGGNFEVAADQMFSLVVTAEKVTGASSDRVTVTIYVNNKEKFRGQISGKIASGSRYATLGARFNGEANARTEFWNGQVDNVLITPNSAAVTPAVRTDFFTTADWAPASAFLATADLYIDFNDAVMAVQNQVAAVTRSDGANSEYTIVTLHDGGLFTKHSSGYVWQYCYASGDPHYYNWNRQHVGGGEQLWGNRIFQTCDTEDFEIRTFTRKVQWWGATVFRTISVRFRDYAWRSSLDERLSSNGYVRERDTRQNTPPGTYMKQINQASWTRFGAGWTVHADTGARYYSDGGYGLRVSVPGVAFVNINGGNGNYMNIYLNMNNAHCTERRGSCDNQLYLNGGVNFEEWISPPALDDEPQPNYDSCDGVTAPILAEIETACGYFYTRDTAAWTDCKWDACAAGDANIVPTLDLTPECLLARVTGEDIDSCDLPACPGNCFGNGVCDEVAGTCTCNTGFTGLDCAQEATFNCHTVTYGITEINVEPKEFPRTTAAADEVATYFADYSVAKSVLVYPVKQRTGEEHLFFVFSSPDNSFPTSGQVCITANTGTLGAPVLNTGAKAGSKLEITTPAAGRTCVSFNTPAFQSGGFSVALTEATYDLDISLESGSVNVDQLLIGSQNGRGGIDVAKVPAARHSAVNYVIGNCDNSACAEIEFCNDCYQTEGCGYCLESGRCMLGSTYGPKRGVCRNWRYELDDAAVSRVVTTRYNGDDQVDPEYEVYLAAFGTNVDVPVNIYVPTGNPNNNLDIHFVFGIAGSYPVNARALKDNLLNAFDNIGIEFNAGIGYYGSEAAVTALTMTNYKTQNQYIFARGLESPAGLHENDSEGGQFRSLRTTAGATGISTGFRKHSRKLVIMTVNDIPSEATLAATRTAVLKSGFMTIFLVPNDAPRSVFNYYNNMNNRIDGIPSLTLRLDPAGNNMLRVFREAIQLSQAFPHIVITNPDEDQYTHVDMETVSAEADALGIQGLTNTAIRARFVIPMMKGDVTAGTPEYKTATFTLPGFGSTTVEDVDAGAPTSQDLDIVGLESDACIRITLKGNTYKDLFKPVYRLVSLPVLGQLYEYDPSAVNSHGPAAVADGNTFYSTKTFCYAPPPKDYSIPATSAFASFQYEATDGCQFSATSTVTIIVKPIPEAPVSKDVVLELLETEQILTSPYHPLVVESFEYDKDGVAAAEAVSYHYFQVEDSIREDFFGVAPTSFFFDTNTGSPLSYTEAYPDFVPVNTGDETINWVTEHMVEYRPPSADFFGTVRSAFQVKDQSDVEAESPKYDLIVRVQGVNDAPVGSSPGYPSSLHQVMQEDGTYLIQILGKDIDSLGLSVEIQIDDIDSRGTVTNPATGETYTSTTTEWIKLCDGGFKSDSVLCELQVQPEADYNTCGGQTPPAEPYTESQIASLCTSPFLTIRYRINDNNDQYINDGGLVDVLYSDVGTINLHVMAVDDRPFDPLPAQAFLTEDQAMYSISVDVEDKDTSAGLLDLMLVTVCDPNYMTTLQQDGVTIISAEGIVEDTVAKRGIQSHTFRLDLGLNVHGGSKEDNFFLCRATTRSIGNGLTSENDGYVDIFVQPVNDAPANLLTTFVKYEDSEDHTNYMDLTATDVDTASSLLTYTITALPYADSVEGALIYPLGEDGLPADLPLTEDDLPFVVTLDENNKARVYVRNVYNWYGSETTMTTPANLITLVYTVTDEDRYFESTEAGYIQNSPESTVTITILPVNDNPKPEPEGYTVQEDTAQIIVLPGIDPAFAEDDDLSVRINDIIVEFSSSFVPEEEYPAVFFRYNQAFWEALSAGNLDTSTGTPLNVEDIVADSEYRIIFVPPQHMNSRESKTETPLFISAAIQYKMIETRSHAEPIELVSELSEYVVIEVESVNDRPRHFTQAWNTLPEYSEFYGGDDWVIPAGSDITTECFENCVWYEDYGKDGVADNLDFNNIWFGGRDVEGSDLDVVIRSVDCLVDGGEFVLKSTAGETPITLEELNVEGGLFLEDSIVRDNNGYQLRALLGFRPAKDSWNRVAAEGRTTEDISGQEQQYYCKIQYAVFDGVLYSDEGEDNEPMEIEIQIIQRNDKPRDSVNNPDVSALVVGYEDTNLYIRFDATDKEGDDFTMLVEECGTRGTFYYPSATQHENINDEGELDTSVADAVNFDMENPVACLGKNNYLFEQTELTYSDTNGKGWYLLFVPVADDSGNEYNFIEVVYDDGVELADQMNTQSSRNIRILSVNDPIEIQSNGQPINGEFDVVIGMGIQSLSLTVSDIDAWTSDRVPSPYSDLAWRVEINPVGRDVSGQAQGPELEMFTVASVDSGTDEETGIQWIQFRGSTAEANEILAGLSFAFNVQGTFDINVIAIDNGRTGLCPPDITVDTTVYSAPDYRATVGAEGTLIAGNTARCNRVTVAALTVSARPDTAITAIIASAGAAALLGLFAVGAVIFAKASAPAELDGWTALDMATMGSVQQNALHQASGTGGQSGIYQGA